MTTLATDASVDFDFSSEEPSQEYEPATLAPKKGPDEVLYLERMIIPSNTVRMNFRLTRLRFEDDGADRLLYVIINVCI